MIVLSRGFEALNFLITFNAHCICVDLCCSCCSERMKYMTITLAAIVWQWSLVSLANIADT